MTTTPPVPAFRFLPIPAEALDAVRTGAADASGAPVEHAAAGGGEPLRCCLRDAAPGEELILFGYALPLPAGPYREVGPVFAHAHPCAGPVDTAVHPPDWRGRPQVLRAYDARGRIHDASRVHDGRDPEKVLAGMFADPGVVRIHSRNIVRGCYMFTVVRAG
ncbi:DUF1203 domain-containing protein [Streptomyces sp. HB2AG]|uniref:DUF1203 domain-containing protein n=1 Tax=Streptomyces sp. HB2AG TaxID=2983400 RepID=UPI0022AADE1C|nr:DUF1203 domain-containing protein [Streptomyces sp. HB2AG]MCZ2524748.1 DUF1203 domain-containing protein [Streptomyces sp. HB2AG]